LASKGGRGTHDPVPPMATPACMVKLQHIKDSSLVVVVDMPTVLSAQTKNVQVQNWCAH